MQLIDLQDGETMGELDRQRAADMDERPIYPVLTAAPAEAKAREPEEVAA